MQPLKISAAQTICAAIEQFVARRTNAVLEVLSDPAALAPERHYPSNDLRFGGAPLRAYYHCHDYIGRDEREHGHFHLFIRPHDVADERAHYSHVAALSMDQEGQPLAWLALNHWVAGGRWLPASKLATLLISLTAGDALDPVQSWLAAMVALYDDELTALLYARDAASARYGAADTVREDRNIYLLAHMPIVLLSKLEQALAHAAPRRTMAS